MDVVGQSRDSPFVADHTPTRFVCRHDYYEAIIALSGRNDLEEHYLGGFGNEGSYRFRRAQPSY